MTLQSLRTFGRLLLQNIKANQLSNTDLDTVIKAGVVQVAADIAPLVKDTYFNVSANTREYDIASNVPDYLGVTEVGLWWNSGTADSPNWKQLRPKTKKWLDVNIVNWRDSASGDPEYYYIEGAFIGTHPKPNTALTNGFRLNHVYRPTVMTNGSDYAFEGAVQIPNLEMLDDCILAYVKWKLTPVSGEQMLENPYEAAYDREIERKKSILNRRPDISNDNTNSHNGPRMTPRRRGRG